MTFDTELCIRVNIFQQISRRIMLRLTDCNLGTQYFQKHFQFLPACHTSWPSSIPVWLVLVNCTNVVICLQKNKRTKKSTPIINSEQGNTLKYEFMTLALLCQRGTNLIASWPESGQCKGRRMSHRWTFR